MMNMPTREARIRLLDLEHVCVKCAMFSFVRLQVCVSAFRNTPTCLVPLFPALLLFRAPIPCYASKWLRRARSAIYPPSHAWQVACFGSNPYDAYLKALISTGSDSVLRLVPAS